MLALAREAQAAAPVAPIEALAEIASAVWEDRDGAALVGIGEAAGGEVWLGGRAFAEDSGDAVWAGFGAGGFVAPRWLYRRDHGRATLTGAGDPAERADILRRLLAPARPRALPAIRAVDGDRDDYRAQVRAALAAIAAGSLEKVVLARRVRVDCAGVIDPAALLARLSGPSSARFLFRRGAAAFVGAPPERLVAKRGRLVSTEALAGSAADAALLGAKDRAEHAWVVTAIADALAPLCETLEVAPEPQLRPLRHVVHLATPIHGRLRHDRHILEVAAALHPTPAVGGVPRGAALDFIRAHEPAARGWYAGPVGWYDARGDGELAVALRSAVVRGATAHLYAGAGIVAGSDPDAEAAETDLKLRTILGALSC